MKGRIIACILTHLPHVAINSLWLLTKCDRVIIFLPRGQVPDATQRLKDSPVVTPSFRKRIKIVPHDIGPRATDGMPPMGLLRWQQQSVLQSNTREGDIGLLLDHDIKRSSAVYLNSSKLRKYNAAESDRNRIYDKYNVRHIKANWGHRNDALPAKGQREIEAHTQTYSFPLTPAVFATRLRKLARAAREGGYQFFGPQYTCSPHNTRALKGGYYPAPTWSGIVGMFWNSPNYYDYNLSFGADADVQFHIIDAAKALGVLQDPCLCIQMELAKKKYAAGGEHFEARMTTLVEVLRRYPLVCRWARNLRCGVKYLEYTGIYGK